MLKKVKEYFKGKNPYLMASGAIVIVSVAIICLLLKGEMSAEQEDDTSAVGTKQSVEESTENLQESKEAETSEDPIEEEVEATEILVMENVETSEVPESEPTRVEEIQEKSEEQIQTAVPERVPVTEIAPTQEPITEPEETMTPENVPELEQEPLEAPESEEQTPQEPPASEETIPGESSVPEITPSPEVTPVPHEHSWIFESWYQEPTCSNGGLVNEICAHCGETQVTGGTPTGEHTYTVESPGDCCSPEVVVCTECNHREVGEKNLGNHIDVEDGFCYGCGKKTD